MEQKAQKEKRDTGVAFRLVLTKPSVRVNVEARLTRPLDDTNLKGGFKQIEDALRQAGLLYDDSTKDIDLVVNQVKVSTESEETIKIRLTLI